MDASLAEGLAHLTGLRIVLEDEFEERHPMWLRKARLCRSPLRSACLNPRIIRMLALMHILSVGESPHTRTGCVPVSPKAIGGQSTSHQDEKRHHLTA